MNDQLNEKKSITNKILNCLASAYIDTDKKKTKAHKKRYDQIPWCGAIKERARRPYSADQRITIRN